jgi:DNA-binding response OmpR family regulator
MYSTTGLFEGWRRNLVIESSRNRPSRPGQPAILHVCTREVLLPLRDQILRISGYFVDSTLNLAEALAMSSARPYDLVLIDVEGEQGVADAEQLCADVKAARHQQFVAFVCNWRVAVFSDCPDEIVRTDFDPQAFVAGVRKILRKTDGQL